jgi:hypothetical protein
MGMVEPMTRSLLLITPKAPPVDVRCDGCAKWERYSAGLPMGRCRAEGHGAVFISDNDDEHDLMTRADFGCAAFEARE